MLRRGARMALEFSSDTNSKLTGADSKVGVLLRRGTRMTLEFSSDTNSKLRGAGGCCIFIAIGVCLARTCEN